LFSVAGSQGEGGGLGAVAGADLGVDVRDVPFHGVDADVQPARDLLVRRAGGEQAQDLAFAADESRDGSPSSWLRLIASDAESR
jgi:hypothetical protein